MSQHCFHVTQSPDKETLLLYCENCGESYSFYEYNNLSKKVVWRKIEFTNTGLDQIHPPTSCIPFAYEDQIAEE